MKSLALTALFALAGCGNAPAMQHATDMAEARVFDLASPDLQQADCGQIVSCAITAVSSNPIGALQCFSGASTEGQSQAGALFACLAQHCIQTGDGGAGLGGLGGGGTGGLGGDPLQLFQCLQTNCATQLTACQGLSI